MTTTWRLGRLRPIVLALVAAALAAPAAQAGAFVPDAVDRYVANNLDDVQADLGLGGPLDAVDRFILNNAPPDAVDRFVRNHLLDGAVSALEPVAAAQPGSAPVAGFDWAAAGVGAGIAFGFMLLAAGAFSLRSRGRLAHP